MKIPSVKEMWRRYEDRLKMAYEQAPQPKQFNNIPTFNSALLEYKQTYAKINQEFKTEMLKEFPNNKQAEILFDLCKREAGSLKGTYRLFTQLKQILSIAESEIRVLNSLVELLGPLAQSHFKCVVRQQASLQNLNMKHVVYSGTPEENAQVKIRF
jgi:hypothetical protein